LKVVYGEGLFIGYRHYERTGIEPLFPFGHGLSYTSFAYGEPTISGSVLEDGETIVITLPVTNCGGVEGAEIVQAYIHDEVSRLPRPEKELQAFDKVFLLPGETKDAVLRLDKYSVGYYDTEISAWIAESGRFKVLIGASSVDIRYGQTPKLYFVSCKLTPCTGQLVPSKSKNHSLGLPNESRSVRRCAREGSFFCLHAYIHI
jgi:beta-glucosidase